MSSVLEALGALESLVVVVLSVAAVLAMLDWIVESFGRIAKRGGDE
ncbi:MAG: hypothetical protein Q8N51_17630 [Gammaproteobacteria bacterium]|nr:hypothetical protein [Gammaproteobacteria bacterium]